jgi:hypothetical protein
MSEQSVSFTSKGLKLSGIIRIPDGLKAGERRPPSSFSTASAAA